MDLSALRDALDVTIEFHDACINGDLKKASNLFRNEREEIDVTKLDKRNTLCITVQNKHEEVVKLLLKIGVNVNQQGFNNETPLHWACGSSASLKITKLLLQNGASTKTTNHCGFTPLHSACMYGKSEIVKTLLQHHANIDTPGITPLHIACVSNRLEVVKELLKHKPDIDPIKTGRLTPLMIAADRGYLEIMEELLQNGANINFRLALYGNALHYAIQHTVNTRWK